MPTCLNLMQIWWRSPGIQKLPAAMDRDHHPSKRVSLAGMRIDRTLAVPLHLQIAAISGTCILRGIFPGGTQFLGSREIARRLGCSRTRGIDRLGSALRRGLPRDRRRGGSVMVASVAVPHAQPPSPVSPAADPPACRSRWRSLLASDYETNWPSEFGPGAPDISSFPSRTGRGCCVRPGKIRESRSASIFPPKAIRGCAARSRTSSARCAVWSALRKRSSSPPAHRARWISAAG